MSTNIPLFFSANYCVDDKDPNLYLEQGVSAKSLTEFMSKNPFLIERILNLVMPELFNAWLQVQKLSTENNQKKYYPSLEHLNVLLSIFQGTNQKFDKIMKGISCLKDPENSVQYSLEELQETVKSQIKTVFDLLNSPGLVSRYGEKVFFSKDSIEADPQEFLQNLSLYFNKKITKYFDFKFSDNGQLLRGAVEVEGLKITLYTKDGGLKLLTHVAGNQITSSKKLEFTEAGLLLGGIVSVNGAKATLPLFTEDGELRIMTQTKEDKEIKETLEIELSDSGNLTRAEVLVDRHLFTLLWDTSFVEISNVPPDESPQRRCSWIDIYSPSFGTHLSLKSLTYHLMNHRIS